jgi:F-type H+-transporting ATPase subunit b
LNINLTLIGQAISFAIFVWFCMKFVWPPITSALEQRKKKIADGLSAAELGEQALEKAKIDVDSKFLKQKVKLKI